MIENRPYPQSVTAERSLIGGLMLSPGQIPDIAATIGPSDFYRPEHKNLFKLLCDMHSRREEIDLVSFPDRIARDGGHERYGGIAYVCELPDHIPSTTNLAHYAEIVVRTAKYRASIDAMQRACEQAFDQRDEPEEIIDQVIDGLGQARGLGAREEAPTTLHDAVDEAIDLKQDEADRNEAPFIQTHIEAIDGWMLLRRRALVMLAARPSMGKSALGLNIALNSALAGEPTGVISIEMDKRMVVDRMLALYTGMPLSLVQDPRSWTTADWREVTDARKTLKGVPFLLWCPRKPTMGQIRSTALRWQMQRGRLAMLMIDYLSLIKYFGDKHFGLAQNTEDCKELAKELDTCVLLLHAVNRRAGADVKNPIPSMEHLKDSGDIEYHIDGLCFVHRPSYYDPTEKKTRAQAIIAKNRQGQCGTSEMEWWGGQQLFRDPRDKPDRPPGLNLAHTQTGETENAQLDSTTIGGNGPGDADIPAKETGPGRQLELGDRPG